MSIPTPSQMETGLRSELIRKQLVQAVFAADYSAAAITAPFVSATGALAAIPAEYQPVGYFTADGISFATDLSMADVTASQTAEPVRSDVESDVFTTAFTPQETNAATVALYNGLPLSGTGALPAIGTAWSWDRPNTPRNPYRRLLIIGQDFDDEGLDIYTVRFMPRARLTGKDDETWSRADPTTRPVTFTAYRDTEYGTSCRNWVDGPGWRSFAPPVTP